MKPLKLYIIADSQPFHRFVGLIEENVDIPLHIGNSTIVEGRTVTYEVATLQEAFDLHKKIFDYLTSTTWYFDDAKVGFCTSGLLEWDEEIKEYCDYMDNDGYEFDELLSEWEDNQE